jgi:hypothetical protein
MKNTLSTMKYKITFITDADREKILVEKEAEKARIKDVQYSGNNLYCCPKCKRDANEKEVYRRKGVKYPIRVNAFSGCTPDGAYSNWDEIHFCDSRNCKTEFYFENGI